MGERDGYQTRLVNGRKRKPRQEISSCLKWICFLVNFSVFLIGLFILSLGIYLCIKDPRGISVWLDVVLNPAIMLSIIGFLTCVISMIGAVGALRDNIQLLKTFAMSLFLCYILLVTATFSVFILFYADNLDGISAQAVLLYAVKQYSGNKNVADIVDYMQEQLECCGVSSVAAGYRDWSHSSTFNCTDTNPYPERCGVPFSCCKKTVVSEAAGSANPLLPAMRSLQCWQNALMKRPQDLESDIHARGCLLPLRQVFESHALHIGMIVAVVIVPVCILVCMTNILARQIDHQRYLLDREARRNERTDRRVKRERERIRMEEAAVASAVAASLRDMEAGMRQQELLQQQQQVQSANKSGRNEATAPKLPDTPPPDKPPAEYTTRKTSRTRAPRATSTSPNRKKSSSRPPIPDGNHKKEKRQRSVPPSGAAPPHTRTKQWVLQQSDLAKSRPNQ